MAFVFNQRVKQGRLDFHPGVAYGFEDPDAVPFFTACGWGADEAGDPAVTITLGELDIDPLTVWNNQGAARHGRYVMPDRAAEYRGITIEEAEAFVWAGQERDNHG